MLDNTIGIAAFEMKADSPFKSASYGSSSYAGMKINGRAHDYDLDVFYGYKNGDRLEFPQASSGFGMSFRTWDFERM